MLKNIKNVVKNIQVSREITNSSKYRLNCVFFMKSKVDLENILDEEVIHKSGSYDFLETKFKVALNRGTFFKGNFTT